ncbi:hypothetical protein K227x_23880 [Rubripirellula lacrimiformis]|uniref:DUF1579 domain-containing protein n=1 Tax=Rubripirellula lacrimiformis TaxID=1930273 RepID=A0A517NA47_9BACT|nr:DUF1579 domain-containing protein [Rubripirellula lacrimiformis]QDT04002.1 hypothetical protein K227x_23880 [Rubripirellula lacrimiformis]
MKNRISMTVLLAIAFCITSSSSGQAPQLPQPGPEFDVFKADIGSWDVQIKTWEGGGEPTISTGRETNRMLGGFWMLSNFQANLMGLNFQGHGMYSYDADAKKYVGTWIDSMGATKMDLIGTYDSESKTITYEGTAPGPDGNPSKHVLATKYRDDGTHTVTMHMQAGDAMFKVFEMEYTKANAAGAPKPVTQADKQQ